MKIFNYLFKLAGITLIGILSQSWEVVLISVVVTFVSLVDDPKRE